MKNAEKNTLVSRILRPIAWSLSLIGLLLGILVGRILWSPLDISFAHDFVTEQVTNLVPGWSMTFKKASFGWDWKNARPVMDVQQLVLVDTDERLSLHVARIDLNLSNDMLLGGGPKVVYVDVHEPQFVVSDLAGFSDDPNEGMIKYSSGGVGFPGPDAIKPLVRGLTRFARRIQAQQDKLEYINLISGRVSLNVGEGVEGVAYAFPRFALIRQDDKFSLETNGTVEFGDLPSKLSTSGLLDPVKGSLSLELGLSALNVAKLGQSMKMHEAVTFFNFPISIDTKLTAGAKKGLETVSFRLDVGEGELSHHYSYPEPAPLKGGTFLVDYDPVAQKMSFKEGELHTKNASLSLTGEVYWVEGKTKPGLTFKVTTPKAQLGDILEYWPTFKSSRTGKPSAGRAWVADHMSKVNAENIVFDVGMTPDGVGLYDEESPIELNFDFVDTDSVFIKTMPKINDANGRGRLNRYALYLDVKDGTVEGINVYDSKVTIDWSRRTSEDTLGDFEIAADGSVGDILTMLDYPPLALTRKFGFDPGRLRGIAKTRTFLKLPLKPAVPPEEIYVQSVATVAEGAFDDILDGEGLRNAFVTLVVTKDDLMAEGNGDLNGVPLSFRWVEDFKAGKADPQANTTFLVANGQIDQAGLKALKVDIDDFLDGTIDGEASFTGRAFRFARGSFTADASSAKIMVPQLGWEKKAGRAANVVGSIEFNDNQINIKPLTVTGDSIDATIDMSFETGAVEPGQGLALGLDINVKQLDNNKNLTGTVQRNRSGHTDVTLTADALDIANIIAVSGAEKESFEQAEADAFTLDLDVKAAQVHLLNNEIFNDLDLKVDFREGEPTKATVSAASSDGATVKASVSPRADIESEREQKKATGNPIQLDAENAGSFLRAMGLFAHGQGGQLTFNGYTSGWGKTVAIEGEASTGELMVVNQKQLAADVTDGVFSGLDEFVEDDGMKLQKSSVPFSYKKGVLDLDSLKANSSSIGITLQGQYETSTRKINMNGVVIPAYGINSLLSNIPLVGTILTGGKGEGVFGITYRIKGQGKNAKFSVNPLSAIAPGIIRTIFGGSKGKVKDVKDDPEGLEEETPPELNVSETATPESQKPEAEKPEASKPEASKPEASKPDASKPDAKKPVDDQKKDEKKTDTKKKDIKGGGDKTDDGTLADAA